MKKKNNYYPKRDARYRKRHRKHRRYLSNRSTARTFVRRYATENDWNKLVEIWKNRQNKIK